MKHVEVPFRVARRRVLKLLGLGAVGTGVFFVASPHRLFAEQFLKEAPRGRDFDMEYDSELQLMVDPKTGEPVFQLAQGEQPDCPYWTAIVTPTPEGPVGDGQWDLC